MIFLTWCMMLHIKLIVVSRHLFNCIFCFCLRGLVIQWKQNTVDRLTEHTSSWGVTWWYSSNGISCECGTHFSEQSTMQCFCEYASNHLFCWHVFDWYFARGDVVGYEKISSFLGLVSESDGPTRTAVRLFLLVRLLSDCPTFLACPTFVRLSDFLKVRIIKIYGINDSTE